MDVSLGRKRLDIVTPIDGSTVGSIPAASKPDVERAIAAANAAHKSGVWGKLPGSKRGAVMRSIAQEVSPFTCHCSALSCRTMNASKV